MDADPIKFGMDTPGHVHLPGWWLRVKSFITSQYNGLMDFPTYGSFLNNISRTTFIHPALLDN